MEAIIAIVVVVVILAIVLIALYNNLVQLRNRVDNAWSQIDVQLQRRLDLIPNLVETVKGYAAHESGTLQKVTEARSAVCNATTPEQKMAADNFLSGTLKSLFAVSEAYPDLKANANFQQLQAEISATEDKISYMRQSYNDTVMNTTVRSRRSPECWLPAFSSSLRVKTSMPMRLLRLRQLFLLVRTTMLRRLPR